jgi:hypothetical protein
VLRRRIAPNTPVATKNTIPRIASQNSDFTNEPDDGKDEPQHQQTNYQTHGGTASFRPTTWFGEMWFPEALTRQTGVRSGAPVRPEFEYARRCRVRGR